ncbi:MAG: cytochrome d ubiquinol oxidase subunit II [Planctomycetes bacterium]|nr:cytochrome d ubiquinol oxidase subunit II [Planctomycetota bacterium]
MGLELAVILALMGLGLTLYVVLGGADFGAGIWEFNSALRPARREVVLVNRAIAPVWEANHVWLIFVLVILWTAFPAAFAALGRALWLPLLLALVGIVFRGVAFAFRSHAGGAGAMERLWSMVFAVASTAAPFFLGACAWAIASGTVWTSPFSIFGAFFSVALCAYLAAVYLVREATLSGDEELSREWRQRALAAGLWMGVLAAAGIVLLAGGAPELWERFRARAWPLVGLSVVAGVGSLVSLLLRRALLAAISAATAAGTVVWGWCVAQYPFLVPPSITIDSARAPEGVLRPLAWVLASGTLLMTPALAFLFLVFKRNPHARAAQDQTAPR